MTQTIQNIINSGNIPYNKNKKRYVSSLFFYLLKLGYSPCVLNDLYLSIDGVDYQFINKRNEMTYIVKPF